MRVCSFFDSSVCAGQHRGKCGIRWMGLPQKSGALQEGRYFPKKRPLITQRPGGTHKICLPL